MKSLNSKIKVILGIAVLVGLIIVGFTLYFNLKKQYNSTLHNYQLSKQNIQYWKDNSGKLHAKYEEVVLGKKEAVALYKQKLDSIAKEFNIKRKQINEFQEMASVKKDTLFISVDTSKDFYADNCDSVSLPFHYTDLYSSINGVATLHNITIQRENRDTLKLIKYNEGALWWKKTYVDVVNSDPKNHVQSIQGLRIDDQKRKIGLSIGPSVQYGYDGKEWKFTVGIGIQYNILKF